MLTTGRTIANDGDVLRFEFDYIIVYKISVYFRAWWDNDGKLIICELNVENESSGYGIKYEIGEDHECDAYYWNNRWQRHGNHVHSSAYKRY